MLITSANDTAAARNLLGERLLLQDLYPERDVFHISEVVNYYQVVVVLLLEEGNLEMAKERHGILLAIDEGQSITQDLTDLIAKWEIEARMKRMREVWRAKRHVTVHNTAPYEPWEEAPVFHHPEVEAFYRHSVDNIPEADLKAIIALPRATLAQDLNRVLEDGLRRYRYFERLTGGDWDEDRTCFVYHAIRFLGVLGYEECLPLVLDLFRQEEQQFDFWFGEEGSSELFRPYFTRVAAGQLPVLQEFMRERHVGFLPKMIVREGVAQAAWHDPACLPEVRDWFGEVFDYYALHVEDEGLIDSDLIGWMAWSVGTHGLRELLPKIETLYRQGALSRDIIGDWDRIVSLFEEPLDDAILQPLPEHIFEFYDDSYLDRRKLRRALQKELERLEKLERDPYAQRRFDLIPLLNIGDEEDYPSIAPPPAPKPLPRLVPVTVQKVGRNEPCTCGSGRKYKHFCGKK